MKVSAIQLTRASSSSRKSQKEYNPALCTDSKLPGSCRPSVQKLFQNTSNKSNAFKFDNSGAETPSYRPTVSCRNTTRAPPTHNYTLQKSTGIFIEGGQKLEGKYSTHPDYKPNPRKSAIAVSTDRGCIKTSQAQSQLDIECYEISQSYSVRGKFNKTETKNSECSRSFSSVHRSRNLRLDDSNSKSLNIANDFELALQAKLAEQKIAHNSGNISGDNVSVAQAQVQEEIEEHKYQKRKNAIEANIKSIRKRSTSDKMLSKVVKNKPQELKSTNQAKAPKEQASLKNTELSSVREKGEQVILSSDDIPEVKTLLQMRLLSAKSNQAKAKTDSWQKSRPMTPSLEHAEKPEHLSIAKILLKTPSREQLNSAKSPGQMKRVKSENRINSSENKIQIDQLLKRNLFAEAIYDAPSQPNKEVKSVSHDKKNAQIRLVLGVKNMNVLENDAKPELAAYNQNKKTSETLSQKFFKSTNDTKPALAISTTFSMMGENNSNKLQNSSSNEISNFVKVNIKNRDKPGKENQNEKVVPQNKKFTKTRDVKAEIAKLEKSQNIDYVLEKQLSQVSLNSGLLKEQSDKNNLVPRKKKELKNEETAAQKTPIKLGSESRSTRKEDSSAAAKAKKFEAEGRKSQKKLKGSISTPRISCKSNVGEKFSRDPYYLCRKSAGLQEEAIQEKAHLEGQVAAQEAMPIRYLRAKSAPFTRASVTTENMMMHQKPPRNTIERDRVPRNSAHLVMQTSNRPNYGDMLQRVTVSRNREQFELSENAPAIREIKLSELEKDIRSTLHLFQDLDNIINNPKELQKESRRNTNCLPIDPQLVIRNSMTTRNSQKTQKSFSPRRSMPQQSENIRLTVNLPEETLAEEEVIDRLDFIKQHLTITKKLEKQGKRLVDSNSNLISPISRLSNMNDTFFRSENSSCQMMIATNPRQLSTIEISHFISGDTLPNQMNSIQEFEKSYSE